MAALLSFRVIKKKARNDVRVAGRRRKRRMRIYRCSFF